MYIRRWLEAKMMDKSGVNPDLSRGRSARRQMASIALGRLGDVDAQDDFWIAEVQGVLMQMDGCVT